jgi:hypothetical protein
MTLRVLQNGIAVLGEIPLLLTTITSFCLSILVAITAFLNFISDTLMRLSSSCLPCSCWTFNRGGSTRELNEDSSFASSANFSSTSSVEIVEEDHNTEDQFKDPTTNFKAKECCSSDDSKNNITNVIERQIDSSTCKEIQQKIDYVENSENEIKQLKNIIKIESEALAALYHDLEAERNASAMAAKETMAMITRLQEEKAIIQLEARQYQRMAEERASHDQEAIDMLKEIITKHENQYDNSYFINNGSLPYAYDLHLKPIHIDLNNKECVERLLECFKQMNPKDQNMILELILSNCLKKTHSTLTNNAIENVHCNINEVDAIDVYNNVVNAPNSIVDNSIN